MTPNISDTQPATRRPVLLLLAGIGLFVTALDAYVVVTLLPAMVADVGLTIDRFEQATPIVTGFLGGYVVAMPLLGAYSDVRGRAPVYALCMLVFAIGSAITATADLWSFAGLPWLVAGRFLQGLGGGGLVPLSLALAADLYRSERRVLALGSVAAMQEAGSVFGPLYGATLAAAAAHIGGWRFVFWLSLPLAAVCAAGLLFASRRQSRLDATAATSLDWTGAALLGAGLGLLVLALYPDDPNTRATSGLLIPVGALSVALLGVYAWRQTKHLEPLIPRRLLRSRAFIGTTGANLLIGVALMVALVDVPLLGRLVFRLDQLGSGLLLSHFLIGVPAGAALGGLLATRIGGRVTAIAGMLLAAAAFTQMAGWQSNELTLRLGPLPAADVALTACGLPRSRLESRGPIEDDGDAHRAGRPDRVRPVSLPPDPRHSAAHRSGCPSSRRSSGAVGSGRFSSGVPGDIRGGRRTLSPRGAGRRLDNRSLASEGRGDRLTATDAQRLVATAIRYEW